MTGEAKGNAGETSVVLVDPRAPRFGQAITSVGLLLGVVLTFPALVYAITLVLVTPVVTRWRFDPYGVVWRRLVSPRVGPPDRREPAAPHRFTKLIGASGTGLASVLLLVGVPVGGYAIAAVIALLAGLAATTGICVGCRMYQQVSFLRRVDIV